jgi:hypothetical protein
MSAGSTIEGCGGPGCVDWSRASIGIAAKARIATVFGQPAFTNSKVMARPPWFEAGSIAKSDDSTVTTTDCILTIVATPTRGSVARLGKEPRLPR